MPAEMSGRAALITGAASGIGRASAIAFAAAGASVALVDIDADGLEDTAGTVKAAGQRAVVFVADVTDLRAVTAAVEDAAAVFGRLDAAHNNAGVAGPYVPLDEYEEEDFMRVLQVDLVGVWRCMRAEIRYMRSQRSGAIVNTSSMLGGAAMPDNGAYIAAKHGVHGLTRAAALELGGTGIRVNAIAPGVTRTGMTSGSATSCSAGCRWPASRSPRRSLRPWSGCARPRPRTSPGRCWSLTAAGSPGEGTLRTEPSMARQGSSSQPRSAEPARRPTLRRELRFVETASVSIGVMAPTLAMSVTGVAAANALGRAAPLAFAFAALGVGLVAYGFVRLAGEFSHAGSVYAFVGNTLGPRAGFLAGWALLGTYLVFPPVSIMGVAIFGRAFLTTTGLAHDADWYPLALAAWVIIWVLAVRGVRPTTRSVLVFEVASVCLILVLMGAIG